jgi:hypothetical protein
MAKKAFAAAALTILAIFAAPAAANAAGYVPPANDTVTGNATAGGTVAVDFIAGSYTNGETVNISVDGSGTATLSVVKANVATLAKAATATGALAVKVTLPTDATGSYTLTGTGATSGQIGTSTITVVAADAGTSTGLASTGYNVPMLLIWSAAGAVLLGIALVLVLGYVRRQRANA